MDFKTIKRELQQVKMTDFAEKVEKAYTLSEIGYVQTGIMGILPD